MAESERFPYLAFKSADFAPYLPLKLSRGEKVVDVLSLVDSGASVNVLPYQIGIELGAVWEQQRINFELSGNLANYEAKALLVTAKIADFPAVNLAFAWTTAENLPLILGQTNFFMEFDVCFFRSQNEFEIKAR